MCWLRIQFEIPPQGSHQAKDAASNRGTFLYGLLQYDLGASQQDPTAASAVGRLSVPVRLCRSTSVLHRGLGAAPTGRYGNHLHPCWLARASWAHLGCQPFLSPPLFLLDLNRLRLGAAALEHLETLVSGPGSDRVVVLFSLQ